MVAQDRAPGRLSPLGRDFRECREPDRYSERVLCDALPVPLEPAFTAPDHKKGDARDPESSAAHGFVVQDPAGEGLGRWRRPIELEGKYRLAALPPNLKERIRDYWLLELW